MAGTNTSPLKWLRSKINSQGTSQRSLAALLGIMVAGLVLRAYRVGFQCLWTEEQYTATIAAEPFSRIIPAGSSLFRCVVRNFSKARILKEIEKCTPLCANCHRKLHYPEGRK